MIDNNKNNFMRYYCIKYFQLKDEITNEANHIVLNFDELFLALQEKVIEDKVLEYVKIAIPLSLCNNNGIYNQYLLKLDIKPKTLKKLKTFESIEQDSIKVNMGKYIFTIEDIFSFYQNYLRTYFLNQLVDTYNLTDDLIKEQKKYKRRIKNSLKIHQIDKKDQFFTLMMKNQEDFFNDKFGESYLFPNEYGFFMSKFFSNPKLLSFIPYLKLNMNWNKDFFKQEIDMIEYKKQSFYLLLYFGFDIVEASETNERFYIKKGIKGKEDEDIRREHRKYYNVYISKMINNFFR